MKYLKSFLILTVIITGGFLTVVSAQPIVDDTPTPKEIERKVFKKLSRLPYYGVFDRLSFQISGGTVILSGKVTVARNKEDAENAVEKIKGVEHVVNNIEILPLSSFDNSIRYDLLETFAARGVFRYLHEPNPSVRIIVSGGHVTLEGYVATRGDSNLMNILANGISGVFSVKNNLIVKKEQIY